MYRLSVEEESVQNHVHTAAALQITCQYLEEENRSLNERIDALNRQKHGLDKVIQEHQNDRDKVVSVLLDEQNLETDFSVF